MDLRRCTRQVFGRIRAMSTPATRPSSEHDHQHVEVRQNNRNNDLALDAGGGRANGRRPPLGGTLPAVIDRRKGRGRAAVVLSMQISEQRQREKSDCFAQIFSCATNMWALLPAPRDCHSPAFPTPARGEVFTLIRPISLFGLKVREEKRGNG